MLRSSPRRVGQRRADAESGIHEARQNDHDEQRDAHAEGGRHDDLRAPDVADEESELAGDVDPGQAAPEQPRRKDD
jgi:hypothetical protein